MLPISMDDFIGRSASHQTGGCFQRRIDFLTEHELGLMDRIAVAGYQFHGSQCDNPTR